MSEQLLVPVDGSARSKEGLKYALEQFPGAKITALHVKSVDTAGDLGLFSGSIGKVGESEEIDEFSETVLTEAAQIGEDHGVSIETESVRGQPARAIVSYVEDNGFDLVVIGSHGRDGATRVLLGSVAEKVLRRSPTPVLVVR